MLNEFKSAIKQALDLETDWKSLRRDWCEGLFPIEVKGTPGPWTASLLSNLTSITRGNLLVVVPDDNDARTLINDLSLFTSSGLLFPWWGTMLYRGVSPHSSIFGQRATVLAEMALGEKNIFVAPLRAALGHVPPPSVIRSSLIQVKTGSPFDSINTEMQLIRFGYNRVPRVSVPGEFALRGEVLDIYPPGNEEAVRIVFEWDRVEEIRLFNPFTQVRSNDLDCILLHPLKEILWDENNINAIIPYLHGDQGSSILESLEISGVFRGEELFYPLLFEQPANLQDYLDDNGVTVFLGNERLVSTEVNMLREYEVLYQDALESEQLVPEPGQILTSLEEMKNARERRIEFYSLNTDASTYNLSCKPGRFFLGDIAAMKEELTSLLDNGFQIFIFAESESQSQRISYLLRDIEGIQVGAAAISAGFILSEARIIAIGESEIFGRRKNAPASVIETQSEIIDTFVDLDPGDFVVHINYGIGLFKGIKRIQSMKTERDYIELEYADDETVFIPIEQVNYIQRYIAGENRTPRLDRMGGTSWKRKKNRAKKSVSDLADRLVKLYAHRQTVTGYAFPKDDDFQVSFEASFPWQETTDQLTSIAEVKMDMEKPGPMDRLICGDVGYGKTEIAMRAAFKAVMGGRQVACLCPTTILAEQHFESFLERYKRFPVRIAMLSRLVPPVEQKKILKGIAAGDIEIVIGTHRILSRDVNFKNIGLIIVDEEQRFGVKDKERLKELKVSVDCLTLSATPIPRTLHMSLVKLRDMSLLKTAPSNRIPIETFVQAFDEDLIANAIRREVERGGQVFFLHNRIESLEQMQIFLRKLVPEVFIEIAHGRMSPRNLESIMHRFVHGAFQVLVSTTIIENGIDIPNVNTIIIDRADMYGISQLYQLRGRVGRSGRLAYAYLLYQKNKEISELAMKRLQVINDFTELGSGFKIAMKDLEVRGAGNLLGSEQTGDICAVGFDLYLKLLEEAILERTESKSEEIKHETYLELDYSGFIPNTYISDDSEKMEIYKKIAAVSNDDELQRLHANLHDRYGPLPDEVHSLISIAEIRVICSKLKVISLKERKGHVAVIFSKVSLISVDKVMRLMNSSRGRVKLDPSRPDGLFLETGEVHLKEKSMFIREYLEKLL